MKSKTITSFVLVASEFASWKGFLCFFNATLNETSQQYVIAGYNVTIVFVFLILIPALLCKIFEAYQIKSDRFENVQVNVS